ncbi:MAG: TlpA family protein disulfide reductase [Candidatus Eremiobacteraeota bacterium]|nr:TlpA family protein disulfide reductase [Candidatus Eremiobacteraeota bacterium]
MPLSRNVLVTIVVAVALVAVALGVNSYFGGNGGVIGGGGGGPALLAGTPAQSYAVASLGGGSGSLSRYRGRVVLVNLWATWCPPCRSETPELERLYRQDRARGLVVLGIDQGESAKTVASFVRAMKLTYPILVDEEQRYGGSYAAIGLPTTVIVGRDGKIVRGIDGALSFAQMREAVDPLLRSTSPTQG